MRFRNSVYCRRYESQWEYEVRTAGGPWPPPQQKPHVGFGLIVACLLLSIGILQFIFNLYIMRIRRITNVHNSLEHDYRRVRHGAHTRSNQFTIDNLEEVLKEQNEYLISDCSDCK